MPSWRHTEYSMGLRAMPLLASSGGPSGSSLAVQAPELLCTRAVRAIWRSMDERDLADEAARAAIAAMLEPLDRLPLGPHPERLIKTLRMPSPLNASLLFWLTRRLLTLVPDLQAAAVAYADGAGEDAHAVSPARH